MRPKRYHIWIMLCALTLGPAAGAAAQAELTPDGGPVTVAEAAGDESVLFANNSAAAIDQDGNVGVAYTTRGNGDSQHLEVFTAGGNGLSHDAATASFEAFSTPTVSATLDNVFVLGSYAEGDGDSLDFVVNGLRLDNEASAKHESEKDDRITPLFREELSDIVQEHGLDCSALKANGGALDRRHAGFTHSGERHEFTITCDDSRKIVITLELISTRLGGVTIGDTDVEVVTEPHTSAKSEAPPRARAPISAIGHAGDDTIMAYLAVPVMGDAYGKITVLELDEDSSVADMVQIDDPLPKPFPGTSIATCGFADFAHYWVAWPTDDGRVVAARFQGNDMDVLDLGASVGAVDMACDGWGTAVVSWAAPDGSLRTVALGPEGATLAAHQQSLGPGAFPDPDMAKVSNDLNEAGEIVVAWSDGGGRVAFRRLKLDGHFRIDGTLSGSHFSPVFDGEGFIFDIVEVNGTPTLVVYYFTYQPDGSGRQAWLVGSGPIEDNRAVAEMVSGSGATFGADFDPIDVTFADAGTVEVTFLSCGQIFIQADSELFGRQAYPAGRLTGRPLAVHGQCGGAPPGTARVDASRGGSHFSPLRDGEGFIFDIVRLGGTPAVVIYYFTYREDGSGDPAWLVGSGAIEGDSATATMFRGRGGVFGPEFDPEDVIFEEWGEITVTWQTCGDVTVEYDGLWGSGSFDVGRLTPTLIGATGVCAP